MRKLFAVLALAALVPAALLPLAAHADDALSPKAQALMEKANKGDAPSAYNLALCFHEGDGCPQNDTEAAKWLTKAADKNDVQALVNLGDFYHQGLGVKQDDNQALNWYRAGAGHGNAEAEYNIGTFYANGYAVKQDPEMARKWYERAANQGLVEAQMSLAQMAMQNTDYATAYFWFAVAAKKDEDAATYRDRVEKTLTADQVAAQQKKVAAWHSVSESSSWDAARAGKP